MTWVSLVCLLVLSGSAFGGYGGGYGSGQQSKLLTVMVDRTAPRTFVSQGYGQVEVPKTLTVQGYDTAPVREVDPSLPQISVPRTTFVREVDPSVPQISVPQTPVIQVAPPEILVPQRPVAPTLPLTPADQLCLGQRAETVIPIDDHRKFVVCLDDGKGVEQECPKGLFYHPTSLRCERKLGPLENLCASQPCLNGGQCIPTGSWYQCQCAAGFDGQTCELDARVCQTQNPCGSSADAKCQSFRLGAALQYICIFQYGYGYGLSNTQVIPSPCRDVDGPQPLSVSRFGFIMCDGERMFIEACPGGTLWDDHASACVWPDMEVPQHEQYGYGQTKLIKSTYTAPLIEKTKFIDNGYGTTQVVEKSRLIDNGYGATQVVEKPKLIESNYGGYTQVVEKPRLIESNYGGSHIDIIRTQPRHHHHHHNHFKSVGGYGAQYEKPKVFQPTYGTTWSVPKPKLMETSYVSPPVVQGY